ncbi:MAG: efflux RND transporter periplasmic adaptor subunit, partial [Deltaproteobacteria bacterium]|nr:efflux RND transporter periplasmic adaptor subunit [Deltaproteobacteria bacterium]
MKIAFYMIASVLIIAAVACSKEGEGPSPDENPSIDIKKVRVHPVRAQASHSTVEYVGTLCARIKVNVATELGGTIEKLFFEKGDRVKKGQALAEIGTSSIRIEVRQAKAALAVAKSQLAKMEKGSRPEEIRIARAVVEQAGATLQEAENNFKRIKGLYSRQAISDSEYDTAQKGVETARANLKSARQQLVLAEEGPREEDRDASRASLEQARAALAISEDRLRKSILHAPRDGVAAFRRIEEQEVVSPGTVITQVVDRENMKITVSIGEQYIAALENTRQFEFSVDAIPGDRFKGSLSFISPTADPVTRAFPLELLVEKPDPGMADGMTVRVTFPLIDRQKTIKVPS